MKRRTLDVALSAGGIAVAASLVVLAFVLMSNANFARDYVAQQLGEQKIVFKSENLLTDDEKKAECLVDNAGLKLTTGKQAECYANEFIGLHLKSTANASGMTYAELGTPQTELRAKIAAATAAKDPNLPALQKQMADLTTARDTMFKGETLRGLLLTSYGFSIFGEKAAQAASVMWIVAGILALLSVLGLVHASATPKEKQVAFLGNGAGQPGVTAPAPERTAVEREREVHARTPSSATASSAPRRRA